MTMCILENFTIQASRIKKKTLLYFLNDIINVKLNFKRYSPACVHYVFTLTARRIIRLIRTAYILYY